MDGRYNDMRVGSGSRRKRRDCCSVIESVVGVRWVSGVSGVRGDILLVIIDDGRISVRSISIIN